MTGKQQAHWLQISTDVTARRIVSIDIFRGMTMFLMIWANSWNEPPFRIGGLPEWLRHAPASLDTMTFVDVIWPAFTFSVGLSIPIAIANRIGTGQSCLKIARHILTRSTAMLLLGIIMGNIWFGQYGPVRSNPLYLGRELWSCLMFVSFFLIWTAYDRYDKFPKALPVLLRTTGVALMIILALLFRQGENNQWFHLNWWILGTLGWGYLIASLIYVLAGKRFMTLVGTLILLLTLYVIYNARLLDSFKWVNILNKYVPIQQFLIIYPFMALTGVVIGKFLLGHSHTESNRSKILWMSVFILGMFVAGYLFRPTYQISKATSTAPWALYSMGYSIAFFALVYLVSEFCQKTNWAILFIPLGMNPLLPYLLSRGLYYLSALAQLESLLNHFNYSWLGIIRNLILTVLLVLFCNLVTSRWNYRMRL
jgi:heparan-alpha-glucosaminide N-acetyltransferase